MTSNSHHFDLRCLKKDSIQLNNSQTHYFNILGVISATNACPMQEMTEWLDGSFTLMGQDEGYGVPGHVDNTVTFSNIK